ncbi:signal transduction histidine kinase [Lachnotalea glycerini]|nr:ATP-binding protein [Lachnotalea glycerini]PXV95516.1 signal transduction histidine kinase [Lachnotalea glycerini]
MKVTLKTKLTLSYILLAVFLIGSFFCVSNYLLISKFQNYIINTQEKRNENLVNLVRNQYGEDGTLPNMAILENIGNTALSQGVILMVSDENEKELFCMSTLNSSLCDNMIESMKSHMQRVYPNFNGEYVQKSYDIMQNDKKVATVTLGYYGPFYYNEEDVRFLTVLNQFLIIVAVLFFIIAIILGFFMANRIARPIKKVIDKTKQIEIGNYADRITEVSRTEEIIQLIHSVNTLAQTLEKQQMLKKRMARDYAHEFRTPLAALQSNLEAMIDGIWEPTKERLDSCRTEILRLTRMIADIDKLVEIESEGFALSKTTFCMSETVEEILLNFQQSAQEKNIQIETNFNQFNVKADKDKIIQVIINLLTNAIKYTNYGGKISIAVGMKEQNAFLSIEDTGIGISKEHVPNIFEHLYRADQSRNRDTGGSGIGLSVVKAIVTAHGGEISVSSVLGRGSKFTIILPIESDYSE